MHLALFNINSDLKLYYNLINYLLNTKMDENLKTILLIDILKNSSITIFEANKFINNQYNIELLNEKDFNFVKNIRNQLKLYENKTTSKQFNKILEDIHIEYSTNRDISLFLLNNKVISSNLIIYQLLVRETSLSGMKGEYFKQISKKISSLLKMFWDVIKKSLQLDINTKLIIAEPLKNMKILFRDFCISNLIKINDVDKFTLYKRLLIMNEIFIMEFWMTHTNFNEIDYCSFYSLSKMMCIKYREIVRCNNSLTNNKEEPIFEKIKVFRNTNHYSISDGELKLLNIDEIIKRWCEQLNINDFNEIINMDNYILKHIKLLKEEVAILY